MRIAVAVFEGAEELDFVGPWEVLAAWRFLHPDEVEVFLVGDGRESVTCAKRMRVLADVTWGEAGAIDVLVYPGGRGTRAQLGDEEIRSRLRRLREEGTLLTSVCTGALVFADAGLLDGKPATTYWSAFDELLPLGSGDRSTARRAIRRRRRGDHGRGRLGGDRHGVASRRASRLARAGARGAPLHPVRPRAAVLTAPVDVGREPLFDPASHEPLAGRPWNEGDARAAIAAIVADAEGAFDGESLWPAHPVDLGDGPLDRVASLFLGAAGVIFALHALERTGAADLRHDWKDVAVALVGSYRKSPDYPERVTGPVPSFWMGESGILLVAHAVAPAPAQEERLLEVIRANVENPSWELMWGSPGTMLAAQAMFERTGATRWLDAWSASADRLWDEWREELWQQDLYGRPGHIFGPAHGFAGNVFALAHGDLLAPARRVELEQRAIAVLEHHVVRHDGMAQWPPALEPPGSPQAIRTQWCHGAPGMVCSFATLAPEHDRLTELLVEGGELTWHAGPLRKGANLCHGTAGNGYAFLKLFERTGDERWLERARAFAMHAIEQVEQARTEHGQGRYTLWTGDLGTALYLDSCLAATAGLPTLDYN